MQTRIVTTRAASALLRRLGQSSGLPSILGPVSTLVVTLSLVLVTTAMVGRAGEPVALGIQVIHATSVGNEIDPRVREFVKDLSALKFTSYALKDEATFRLEVDATGRMQLPNGAWLTIVPQGFAEDGKLRLFLEVKKLKFKTIASVAKGATIAVGGPPYDNGTLILAVTRTN